MVTKAELLQGSLQQREQVRKEVIATRQRQEYEREIQRQATPEYQQALQKQQEELQQKAIEEATKQYAQESISKVESQIQDLSRTLEALRNKPYTNERKAEIETFEEKIIQLQGVKEMASTGKYETSSLINYALSKAEGIHRPKEYIKQSTIQYDTSQYEKIGLKPITDTKGNITGFEDTKLQKSYTIKNIPQSRLGELKAAGLAKITTTQIPYTPTAEEQLLGFQLTPKEFLTSKAEEVKAITQEAKRYEASGYTPKEAKKLAEYSYYTRTTPTLTTATQQGLIFKETPISLKKDVLGKSGWYFALPYLGQQVSRGLEKLGIEKVPIVGKVFKKGKEIESPSWLTGTVMAAPLFTFFGTAMKTGTAAQLEEEGTLKFLKKRQKAQLIETPTAQLEDYTIKFERAYASEGEKGVVNLIKKYMDIIKKQTNPINKEIAIKNVNLILRDLTNKGIIKYYSLTDTGELTSLIITKQYPKGIPFIEPSAGTKLGGEPFTLIIKKPVKPTVEYFAPKPAEVPVSILGTSVYATKGYTPSTKLYLPAKELKLFQPKLTGLSLISSQLDKQATSSMLLPTQAIKQQQSLLLKTSLQLKQMQQQKQLQLQKQVQLLKTRQLLRTQQQLKQQQQLRQRQITKQIQIPKLKIPRIKFPSTSEEKKKSILKSLIGKVGEDLFVGQIRRKKKWFDIGKGEELPFALKKAIMKTKTTLGASLRIISKATGQPVRLNPISPEFKLSKRETGVLIQQRGFRLGTRGEVSEIQTAKKTKRRKLKWL